MSTSAGVIGSFYPKRAPHVPDADAGDAIEGVRRDPFDASSNDNVVATTTATTTTTDSQPHRASLSQQGARGEPLHQAIFADPDHPHRNIVINLLLPSSVASALVSTSSTAPASAAPAPSSAAPAPSSAAPAPSSARAPAAPAHAPAASARAATARPAAPARTQHSSVQVSEAMFHTPHVHPTATRSRLSHSISEATRLRRAPRSDSANNDRTPAHSRPAHPHHRPAAGRPATSPAEAPLEYSVYPVWWPERWSPEPAPRAPRPPFALPTCVTTSTTYRHTCPPLAAATLRPRAGATSFTASPPEGTGTGGGASAAVSANDENRRRTAKAKSNPAVVDQEEQDHRAVLEFDLRMSSPRKPLHVPPAVAARPGGGLVPHARSKIKSYVQADKKYHRDQNRRAEQLRRLRDDAKMASEPHHDGKNYYHLLNELANDPLIEVFQQSSTSSARVQPYSAIRSRSPVQRPISPPSLSSSALLSSSYSTLSRGGHRSFEGGSSASTFTRSWSYREPAPFDHQGDPAGRDEEEQLLSALGEHAEPEHNDRDISASMNVRDHF